uniref:Uncharacterized protein n=1 Tax=Panagrolaimus superbus TaxID=310955 RepID=A0A914ZC41_9BILA
MELNDAILEVIWSLLIRGLRTYCRVNRFNFSFCICPVAKLKARHRGDLECVLECKQWYVNQRDWLWAAAQFPNTIPVTTCRRCGHRYFQDDYLGYWR